MKKGWQTKRLGDVAVVGAGNSAPQDEAFFEDGTIPFFRTADAGRVRFGDIAESTDYLNDKGVKGLRRFAPGTILFPKSGASTFLNHRVMLGVDGCVSSHLATIVADEKQAHPRFLLYFLSTIAAQDLVQDHAYPSLNLPTIAGIEVHFPTLAEQQRIVGLLDEAFEGIATAKANAEKNLQNAHALFESHLQSVFTQRGQGWKRKPLGSLCDLISGQHIDAKDYNTEGKGVGYLTGPSDFGFLNPVITKWSEHPKRMAKRGDILVTVKGSGVGKINLLAEEEVAISRQLMAVRATAADVNYLYAFLSTNFDHFQSLSTGAAIPGISREDVLDLMCPMPPPEEQQAIVKLIHALAEETQRLARLYEQKLAALEALKKSLLHQAFTGAL